MHSHSLIKLVGALALCEARWDVVGKHGSHGRPIDCFPTKQDKNLPPCVPSPSVEKREVQMGYREARELARIRQELRERLLAQRSAETGELLARFRYAAEAEEAASPELLSEHERWRFRFELLAVTATTP